jgi:signal transduction histidine kinase
MLDDPDLPAADRLTMLQVVRRNVGNLHTTIDKLLDIAGMQAGRITVDPHDMDLTAVVRAGAARARHQATDKALDLDLNLPAEAVLRGDPGRLSQVIDELLSNAVTWADEGSRIAVSVTTDGPITQLTVSNTGPVIPTAERDRLFDRFFRTASAGQRAIPGTGLGLSLARTIVEQHGGSVTATSDDAPTGTTITVRLPTHAPPRSPGRKRSADGVASGVRRS